MEISFIKHFTFAFDMICWSTSSYISEPFQILALMILRRSWFLSCIGKKFQLIVLLKEFNHFPFWNRKWLALRGNSSSFKNVWDFISQIILWRTWDCDSVFHNWRMMKCLQSKAYKGWALRTLSSTSFVKSMITFLFKGSCSKSFWSSKDSRFGSAMLGKP